MKNLFLLIFTCLIVQGVKAQNSDDHKPHKITFVAGWNYSKYVGGEDAIDKTDYKSGLILGLNKDVKISPALWANGGLLYYQNGADTDLGEFKFNYLMLPTGLKLKVGPVYGMAGVYGAYRLTADLDGEKADKGDFNRLDFGAYSGVGIRFLVFTVNAKYNWGLSDVSNGSNDNPSFDLNNRFFSLALGVGIP